MSWEEAKNQLRDVKLPIGNEPVKDIRKNEMKSSQKLESVMPTILNESESDVENITEITNQSEIKNESKDSVKTESSQMQNKELGTSLAVRLDEKLYTPQEYVASRGEVLLNFSETLQVEERTSLELTRCMGNDLHGLMKKLITKKDDHEFQKIHSGDINDICKVAAELTKVIKARSEIIKIATSAFKESK